MKRNEKLLHWQQQLTADENKYLSELNQMDVREDQYRGIRNFDKKTRDDVSGKTAHVRNISAELIEAQVNTNIPSPKVTPKRKEDEYLAKLIEDMLRNELDRLPVEAINDMMERTVPIQGGCGVLLEWDNAAVTPAYIGEVSMQVLHPKVIIPQDGVTDSLESMDHFFVKVPTTKGHILRQYGVDMKDETEEEPELRGAGREDSSESMITMYVAYYRNKFGGIGKYVWAGDTELEDIDDYQARRMRVCAVCGEAEPALPVEELPATVDGSFPLGDGEHGRLRKNGDAACPYCGSTKWKTVTQEYEEIWEDIELPGGRVIPGARDVAYPAEGESAVLDENGAPLPAYKREPTKIPWYKPDIFPVFIQKNVSVYGKFMGESDLDKIADQQNTTNRIHQKVLDKLLQAGSYLCLPDDADIKVDSGEMKVIRPGTAANASFIKVFDMEGNISQDMAYMAQVYEEARQAIGITDSFQGRKDATATSGKAKEFSAAQAAGRMESKRINKNDFYQRLFEGIFKMKLAYTDEPRPVVSIDANGEKQYSEFSRYLFLKQDENGKWYYNDQFIFSCDTAAPLAANREAMWQELNMYYQAGAFGDPRETRTQILFWTQMEALHYPMAGNMKKLLSDQLAKAEEQQKQAAEMAKLQAQAEAGAGSPAAQPSNEEVAAMARRQAAADMGM